MPLIFLPDTPMDCLKDPVLISGPGSLLFCEKEFLLYSDNDTRVAYEIRYEQNSGPFKQAEMLDNLLVAGHGERFYMFDTARQTSLLILPMDWYFGHFYVDGHLIYVTDATGMYCIDRTGTVRWHTPNLGIDGVIIKQFTPTQIEGSGEWDPPGGWKDFSLNKQTGQAL